MKKNLTIIASAVLALGMLFVTGCTHEAPMKSDDIKEWNVKPYPNQTSNNKGDFAKILQIKADENDVDWWVITDEKYEVIPASELEINKYVDSTTPGSSFKYSDKITNGDAVDVKFKNITADKDYILWTHQTAVDSNEKAVKTYRGKVTVHADQGGMIEASGWKEKTIPVCVLKMTCDETNAESRTASTPKLEMHPRKGHGDYKITELWPLRWTDVNKTPGNIEDDKYVAVDGFNLLNLDIAEGTSRSYIFPADGEAFFLAIKQPNRYLESEEAYATQKDYMWCFKTEFTPQHQFKTLGASASFCNARYDAVNNKVFSKNGNSGEWDEVRFANPAYFIDESEFVEAGDIK